MDGLKSYFIIGVVCILSADLLHAQTVTRSVPVSPLPSHIYLFYLHGGVVQERGANAVSEYYGKYEYHAILDTLANRGFHVISEVRPKDTETEDYARKVRSQIDTLLISGIPPGHIVVVGASLGAYIALETALQLKHPGIKYVLIGLCSEYARGYFSPYKNDLTGKFLSIYERSDAKGSCREVFSAARYFEEVELNMGIDHAFLFKPYNDWVDPLVQWVKRGAAKPGR